MQICKATGAQGGQHASTPLLRSDHLPEPTCRISSGVLPASQATMKVPRRRGLYSQGVGGAKEAGHEHYALPVAQSPVGFSPRMMFATVVAHRSLQPQKYSRNPKHSISG